MHCSIILALTLSENNKRTTYLVTRFVKFCIILHLNSTDEPDLLVGGQSSSSGGQLVLQSSLLHAVAASYLVSASVGHSVSLLLGPTTHPDSTNQETQLFYAQVFLTSSTSKWLSHLEQTKGSRPIIA